MAGKRAGDEESLFFNLPNDSIMSIWVRPGCWVTLYEHGNFEGKSAVWDGDSPDLGEWARQASSLKVETRDEADEGVIGQWLQVIENDGQHRTEPIGELNDEEIAKVLAEHEERFTFLKDGGEGEWYGDTTDEERVEMGNSPSFSSGSWGTASKTGRRTPLPSR